MSTLRRLPPVSAPVGLRPVLTALLRSGTRGDPRFAASLGEVSGCARVELYGSGRAALTDVLARWKTAERDEAVLPAYTCWTVAASAVRAGMRVRLVDVDPVSLDLDLRSLAAQPMGRVAAVVAAHLFARTCNVAALVERLREKDPEVRVIEDAAQAWPTRSGSGANALLLSFGRGKPLPLGGGGALLHDDSALTGRQRDALALEAGMVCLATTILGRPPFFGMLEPVPFLGIGRTIYDPDFDADAPFGFWRERLGAALLPRLPSFVSARSGNAAFLRDRVENVAGWTVTASAWADGPIRLAALAPSRAARGGTLQRLRALGVGASPMYPGGLADIPRLRPHVVNPDEPLPGARTLADRLLTLPTYPGLRTADLGRIATAFRRAAAG